MSTFLFQSFRFLNKIIWSAVGMNYETRLAAAAKFVYAADSSNEGETPVDPAEIGVTATLKPHQVEGLSWLIRRYKIGVNVVLGDEMGLGKTLQAISFLSYLKIHQNSSGPFLVLCPLSVTDGWVSEIANFTPKLKVLSYIGEKDHRQKLRRSIYEHVKSLSSKSHVVSLPFDVLLTTYDIVLMDQEFLSQFSWTYAIVDEAQRLKNPSSVLYAVLNERFVMPRRLLMTGTPIQNNLTELWALMHFCMPSVFGTLEQFLLRFKETGFSGDGAAQAEREYKVLRYVLGAFMLRRTKSKLIAAGSLVLPPLSEITVLTPLVALQKKVYMSILRKELPRLLAFSSGSSNHQSLQNIVIQLRKTCSHPYLFPGIEPEPYEEGEHLIMASGKLIILDQLLRKLHQSGHRVLLFAQMTHTLDILQDFMELRKYSYERLDGSVRAEERFAAIRSFSKLSRDTINTAPDQDGAFVFMISTRAGGVGLNLVAADTVIFYEQDWNPQVDKQALQRAHRIGQMNHVLSISLVTGKTVEEVIMRRAERKLQLSNNVIGENVDNTKKGMEGAMAGDLHSVIYGLNMLDPTDTSNGNSDEIDTFGLDDMAETVLSLRYNRQSDKDNRKYEVNPMDLSDDHKIVAKDPDSVYFDPGFDEASYLSWVKKFEEVSKSCESATVEPGGRRDLLEDRNLKTEAARKKAEEKKLAEWEAHGYHSLSVKEPMTPPNGDMMSDSVFVHSVYGDCTHPYNICPSEPTIVFSCTDDSGNWGHGGMFDALAKLSVHVPTAYEQASNFKDLRLGDLHLVEIKNDIDEGGNQWGSCHWVALAVVQSYNPRRKVPRSNISLPALESCLSKVSSVAAQNSASIHMPRIGYQDASDRSEWYTIERLLRKYAFLYGTRIYVYYYCRSS